MNVYIQCTAKLLKKLDHSEYNTVISPNILSTWHANLLRINRKECVLFTDDTTLYSICIPKTTPQFFNNLGEAFLDNLIRNLEHENLQKDGVSVFLEYPQVLFVKSTNRSVLGAMNNMAQFIEYFVYESGGLQNTNILKLNSYINRIPFSSIKYKYPVKYLHELLFKRFVLCDN